MEQSVFLGEIITYKKTAYFVSISTVVKQSVNLRLQRILMKKQMMKMLRLSFQ